jgi:hypothetical protein
MNCGDDAEFLSGGLRLNAGTGESDLKQLE